MTKGTNGHSTKPKGMAKADIIVFGRDQQHKTLAGRFPAAIADLAIKAAKQQSLSTLRIATAETVALAARLAVGRVHSRGAGFVPAVRRDLYDQIDAIAHPKAQAAGPEADASAKATPTAALPIPKNEAGTEGNPAGSDGLPASWQEIAAGHLVLAQESVADGWWEAIVVERRDDMVTLRWRGYPKYKAFVLHVDAVALVNPAPSFKSTSS
jgi:hypothetical protein